MGSGGGGSLNFRREEGAVKKRESPDFKSPEVGISLCIRDTNREASRFLFASLQLNLSLHFPAGIVLSFISAVN